MIVTRLNDNFDAVRIDNTFSNNQLSYIWKELEFLTNKSTMQDAEKTGSAKTENGENAKKNHGVFLNEIYRDLRISAIYNLLSIKVQSQEVFNEYQKMGDIHRTFKRLDSVGTLVSYYQDNDKYDWHKDSCVYSAVCYLYKEPKSFSGGEINFYVDGKEYTYDIKNNMTIIFPSSYLHSVNQVKMNGNYEELSTFGRYCISQFMSIAQKG